MIKFSEIKLIWKLIASSGAIISALAVIFAGVTWAADTRYQTLLAQAEYVQQVSEDNTASEIRQLKRDIRRLELKDENGNASPEDKAFIQFLKQDLEDLQQN